MKVCYNAQCIICLAWQWTWCNVRCGLSYAVDVWSLSALTCISCTWSNDKLKWQSPQQLHNNNIFKL